MDKVISDSSQSEFQLDRPVILREGNYTKKDLNDFKTKKIWRMVDLYAVQLEELFEINNSGLSKESKEYEEKWKKYRNKKTEDGELSGNWVYLPWNGIILHIVGEKDYITLKTNRNRDLITKDEQENLYRFNVAVLGMSVGSNIAFVLTQAGISGEITIADFDILATTNLNRIWAGAHQVGLKKTTIAARRIYEDNPYAKVNVYSQGMGKENLEKLLRNKKIDCIVEEIDSMQMKIDTRILAMKYKVPVLMVTDNGDFGVLHVERFDLGYRKIFNKKVEYWGERMADYAGKEDFADIVINDIVGGPENVDPRMLRSSKRVMSNELVSWPQLGSAALLGGIAVAYVVKQILRGESKDVFFAVPIKPL